MYRIQKANTMSKIEINMKETKWAPANQTSFSKGVLYLKIAIPNIQFTETLFPPAMIQ